MVTVLIRTTTIWQTGERRTLRIQHWPEARNIADIGTKGKTSLEDIKSCHEWQTGPWELQLERRLAMQQGLHKASSGGRAKDQDLHRVQ